MRCSACGQSLGLVRFRYITLPNWAFGKTDQPLVSGTKAWLWSHMSGWFLDSTGAWRQSHRWLRRRLEFESRGWRGMGEAMLRFLNRDETKPFEYELPLTMVT